jgi:hypothetical protein
VELIDDLHRGLAGAPWYAAARLRGKFGSSAVRVLAALAAPVEFADLLAVSLVRLNAAALLDGGARGRSAGPQRPRVPLRRARGPSVDAAAAADRSARGRARAAQLRRSARASGWRALAAVGECAQLLRDRRARAPAVLPQARAPRGAAAAGPRLALLCPRAPDPNSCPRACRSDAWWWGSHA